MKLKSVAGFQTRNVPHKAHQWIHNFLYKKFGALLIQPLIGQYKKGEYKDYYIMKTNQKAVEIFKSTFDKAELNSKIDELSSLDIFKLTNKYFSKPYLCISGNKKTCLEIKTRWNKNF